MSNKKIEQIIDNFQFVAQNSDWFQIHALSEEEKSFFGIQKLVNIENNHDELTTNEITFLAKGSVNLNRTLVIRWVGCDDNAWDTYFVEYDGKHCGSFSVTVGSRVSMVQSYDSSVQIVAAKSTLETDGVRINAVICVHKRLHKTASSKQSSKIPTVGQTILAFNKNSTDLHAIEAAIGHVGKWIKRPVAKQTPQDIKKIFLNLYKDDDIGYEIDDMFEEKCFSKEIDAVIEENFQFKDLSQLAKSFLYALKLASANWCIFAGNFEGWDEIFVDGKTFCYVVDAFPLTYAADIIYGDFDGLEDC